MLALVPHGCWRYVLVDEYQDTNRAQYRIMQLADRASTATSAWSAIDDQSIYGWRGADIRNILDFEKDYPGRQVVRARAELPLDPEHPGIAAAA